MEKGLIDELYFRRRRYGSGGGSLPWATFMGNPLQFNAPKAHVLKSVKVEFSPIQNGSGDPSPDNVRPISGWTALDVYGAGENLCNGDAYYMGISSGVPAIVSLVKRTSPYTTSSIYTGIGFTMPVKAGETYSISSDVSGGDGTSNNYYIGIYEKLEDATDRSKCLQYAARQQNFTAEYDGIAIFMKQKQASGSTFTWTYAQANLGSTASPYSPYTGETYSITWQDEAGTVYGGYLLINEDGSVDVERTWKKATIISSDVSSVGTSSLGVKYALFASQRTEGAKGNGKIISEIYKNSNDPGTNNSIRLIATSPYAYDNRFTDLDTAKALLNGMDVFFELATPVTYHLPSLAEAIRCFKGINTIWSDANGDVTVEARAEAVNLNALQSLNMLLGGRYVNNHTAEDLTDEEALDVLLGRNTK